VALTGAAGLGLWAWLRTRPAAEAERPPDPPADVRAAVLPSGAVELTWRAGGSQEGFKIERTTDPDAAVGWRFLGSAEAEETRFVDTAAPPDRLAFYRVTAVRGGARSTPAHAAWPVPSYGDGF